MPCKRHKGIVISYVLEALEEGRFLVIPPNIFSTFDFTKDYDRGTDK
jgi:hypothetical protein